MRHLSDIQFLLEPFSSVNVLIAFSFLVFMLTFISLLSLKHVPIWRVLIALLFLLTLLNPLGIKQERQSIADIAVILKDQSASQVLDERTNRSEKAFQSIQSQLNADENIILKTIQIPKNNAQSNKTDIMKDIEQAFSDVPISRRAGIVLISDGQIHDIPSTLENLPNYGPVHLLLSGEKNEIDREIKIIKAPGYGITGQNVTIKYRIDDGTKKTDLAPLSIKTTNEEAILNVPLNTDLNLVMDINHPGQNIFELTVPTTPNELTEINNKRILVVNGIRDRLKVLLVSGKPHPGGRNLRNLLNSDPAVDLVHFTILREPIQMDATPQNELSLIAFPFRELFEVKLYDFDLIIMDQYKLNRILPTYYFENIVRYVNEGGALLVTNGADYASSNSIFFTSLSKIIPGRPSGSVIETPFRPRLTPDGKNHPVTAELTDEENWGQWFQQIPVSIFNQDVLLSGAENRPLLILQRQGQGRIAQITSDHLSLWARGYDGGGPYTELLRRLSHWLMKEPELDEMAMHITLEDKTLHIRMRQQDNLESSVLVLRPDGKQETISLKPDPNDQKWWIGSLRATTEGVYRFQNTAGAVQAMIVGELQPPEFQTMRSSAKPAQDWIEKTGGGVLWLSETAEPSIRILSKNRSQFAGRHWIGFRNNDSYDVKGTLQISFIPAWIGTIILLCGLAFMWWREGKN